MEVDILQLFLLSFVTLRHEHIHMRNHLYQRKDGEGKNDPILSLEFHSSGVLVTAGHDAIIRFWKLALPIAPVRFSQCILFFYSGVAFLEIG